MMHPKIAKIIRDKKNMDEFLKPSNITDDEAYFEYNYLSVDEIERKKQEIKNQIKEHERKIGELILEFHKLQDWVSPDGLD